MTSHKNANNFEKRAYDIPYNSKMYNDEGRNEQFYMLLSTTYSLNNSHKKITCGTTNNKQGRLQVASEIKRKRRERNLYFDVNS